MLPYQERVVSERKALDRKIAKLCKFLESDEFENLGHDEKMLLAQQQYAMLKYSEILLKRIALFDTTIE